MPDTIQAKPREALGKAVKKLRREGVLPASVYGRGIESIAIELPYVAGRDLMNAHGFNALINLDVEGEAQPRPVVVKQIDQHPVTREIRHIDFYQVDLTRKISGPVPIHFIGEAPAVDNGGVLVLQADHIEVEALPADMPESVEISLESLDDFDTYLHASDLRVAANVTVLADDDLVLATVTRPRLAVEEDEEAELAEGEQEGVEGAEGEGDESEGEGGDSEE